MTQRYLRAPCWATLVLLGLTCSAGFSSRALGGDSDLRTSATAEQLVKEALHREVYGMQQDRDRLLSAALQRDPDHAPARWHQGFVSYRGNWTLANAIPELLSKKPAFVEYGQQRRKCADDLAGNLSMAKWCRQHQLAAQERAHLSRVIDFSPDHALARSRLGYRRTNSEWKTKTEIRRESERDEARRIGLVRWRGRIERLRSSLRQRDDEKRTLAETRVRDIRDPAAIGALETVLGDSERGALLVVETIAEMKGEESVQALIRQAVLSPWIPVRQAAARALGRRERERYVPLMLTEMYTQVTSRAEIVPAGNNRFVYRHAFLREGQDQQQELVLDTQYRRLVRPGGVANDTLMRALTNTLGTALARERSVAQQNRFAAELNQRISSALSIATGQQLPAAPQSWWQWWDNNQDVVVEGQKQTRRIQRTTRVALADRVQTTPGGIQVSGSPRPQRKECFAAGTPVWTASGLVAIETVRVGDLVLSQDPRIGELTYKPVLRTTVRAAERLVKVEVGEETFETSGGHLFWVVGDGWMRSRELQSGMRLHGLVGSVPVYEVGQGATAETFNLAVADFGTYFVGRARVLSHDVTGQKPTDSVVPGLIDR